MERAKSETAPCPDPLRCPCRTCVVGTLAEQPSSGATGQLVPLAGMQLRATRLCLDCEELHEGDRCPVCASEAFVFLTRWVPADERRANRRPQPAAVASRRRVPRLIKGSAIGLALYGIARLIWRATDPGRDRTADSRGAHGWLGMPYVNVRVAIVRTAKACASGATPYKTSTPWLRGSGQAEVVSLRSQRISRGMRAASRWTIQPGFISRFIASSSQLRGAMATLAVTPSHASDRCCVSCVQ
jgi:hypothetical protein